MPSSLPGAWPSARYGARIAYDSARARIVGFGGTGPPDGELHDLWEWDPSSRTWTDRTPTPLPASWPPSRVGGFSLVYDADRARTVLFFGVTQVLNSSFASEVWEWNGTDGTWTNRGVPPSPLGDTQDPVIYDSGRRKMVVWKGGCSGACQTGAWEWDGASGTWTDRTPSPLPMAWPSQRFGFAAVYDAARSKVFLFGGNPNNGFGLRDVWEWSGAK